MKILFFFLLIFPLSAFDSAEHVWMGDLLELSFPDAPPVCIRDTANLLPVFPRCKPPYLHLENGLSLSYGQIMALGGDFYAPSHPITEKNLAPTKKEKRFLEGYNNLAVDEKARTEVIQIYDLILEEFEMIQSYLERGQAGLLAYKDLGLQLSRKWNRITGGGSRLTDWFPKGRYIKIQESNFDHFYPDAWEAYEIGHRLALLEAQKGFNEQDQNIKRRHLEKAYALNAFASHYLSDIFSTGHMRTPRHLLPHIFHWEAPGHYLSKFMHDEDGLLGLYVQNKNGDEWRAYGDGTYFEKLSDENRQMLQKVLQISVDEVYENFIHGKTNLKLKDNIADLIPTIWDIKKNGLPVNHAPLFLKHGPVIIVRRKFIEKPFVYEFTHRWFGFTTIRSLHKIKHSYQHFGPSDVLVRKFPEE